MHAVSGCDSVSSFSHIAKITTSQTLKNKTDVLIDMIDFGEFPSLSSESPSVARIQYVGYLCEQNKSVLIVSKLHYSQNICQKEFEWRSFTINVRATCTSSAQNINIFSNNICLIFFLKKNIKYNMGKTFFMYKIPLYRKTIFFV